MGNCNSCKEDRPDILRSNISICGDGCSGCNDCSDKCDIEDECDCPSGHMTGGCLHYSGCKTFITQLNPGMTFDQVVFNIEATFETIDKILEKYCDRISELELIIKEYNKKDKQDGKCDEWEGVE